MTDDKFELIRSTAGDIAAAWTKHERLVDQRRTVVREVDAANGVFDKALASNGALDVTIPQRRVLESLMLLGDCEKRIVEAKEKLIEACACIEAEGFFK